jgi:Na+/H+ antiporter NhaC
LPTLIILVVAWALGNVFTELGAGEQLAKLLTTGFRVEWLPLVVFVAGLLMSFTTGSSWSTMGLLMPLALPATLVAATAEGIPLEEMMTLVAAVIGAVFGGATFGDHCSPFSDTTIVSAIASGCQTTAHVHSQFPFAGLAAGFAALSYSLMAGGLGAIFATLIAAFLMCGAVKILALRVKASQHAKP